MKLHTEWDPRSKVYMAGLRSDCDKDEIKEAFSEFGRVLKVWIAQRPPGFGFVLMSSGGEAGDAVRGLHGTKMWGRRVAVEMAHSKYSLKNIDSKIRERRKRSHTRESSS